jgi:hypothetical protein
MAHAVCLSRMLDAAIEHAGHGVPLFQVWHAEGAQRGGRALDEAAAE